MNFPIAVIASIALALFGPASRTFAQTPVQWTLELEAPDQSYRPGELFRGRLIARIDDGWHLYAITQAPGGPIATQITVLPGQPFELAGEIEAPAPHVAMDPNFNMETQYYEGETVFGLSFRVLPSAAAASLPLKVGILQQACNDRLCTPPLKTTLTAMVRLIAMPSSAVPAIEAKSSATAPSTTLLSPPATVPAAAPAMSPETSPSQSVGSFIWLAMVMGALSLITPCVFPMIPITVSYFTKQAAGGQRAAVGQALVYSGGIILTFTALGMALAILVGAAGINQFAANPWINLLITAIFVGFAFNLFGAYIIQIPSSLLTRLHNATGGEEGSRTLGTLLMGLTFTLTSFTCTAPFIGTLLVMASQGNWRWPLLGMVAYSSVFALPFFILALLPQLMAQLPKSGAWLNSVKVVMGFLEIAAAMKFISNVDLVWGWGIFTREAVLATWVALAVVATLYLLGLIRLPHEERLENVGAMRMMIGVICLTVGFWLLTGLLGRRLGEIESFLPPASEDAPPVASTLTRELSWITNDLQAALAQGQRENRKLFVDFTGYTCTNCRWMEANMFTRPDVKSQLEAYVRVRLYTDGVGEPYESHLHLQQQRYGTVALPFYAVVRPDGSTVTTFAGLTRDPHEFIAFLQKGQADN